MTVCKAPKWCRSELTLEVLAQNRSPVFGPAVGPGHRRREGGCWVPTVEALSRAGSSRVAGSKGGRRPVAPASYRAQQAGKTPEKAATREKHLKKSLFVTSAA